MLLSKFSLCRRVVLVSKNLFRCPKSSYKAIIIKFCAPSVHMRSSSVELVKPPALALHMRLQALFRQSGKPAPPLKRLMFVTTPGNSGGSGWYQRTSAPLDWLSASAPATSSVYSGSTSGLVAATHASCAPEAGSNTTRLLLTSSRGVVAAFSSQNTRGFCSSAAQRVGHTSNVHCISRHSCAS